MSLTPCSRTGVPEKISRVGREIRTLRAMLDTDIHLPCEVCHNPSFALKLMKHPSGQDGLIKVCNDCYPGENK